MRIMMAYEVKMPHLQQHSARKERWLPYSALCLTSQRLRPEVIAWHRVMKIEDGRATAYFLRCFLRLCLPEHDNAIAFAGTHCEGRRPEQLLGTHGAKVKKG